ncbi:Exosome complex component N-terminal domain [Trinorchestia longiramus]|nr:Exosome complex component N-terminal domain [Trinorchestia longiramus]
MEIQLASECPPQEALIAPTASAHTRLVTPGEVIYEDTSYMRGHGTYMEDGKQIASVAGYVTQVNRLVTVTPLRQLYQGAVGDTIVGRVTQVGGGRWKLNVNSRLDAELKLVNVQLPGGEQRRKNVEDERGMRNLLSEGALVCVEVQKVGQDGILRLAARTTKFGKLGQGVLVQVSPSLLVQDKQRMHDLPCGARVIFGANGYIFVSPTCDQDQALSYTDNYEEVGLEVRQTMARLSNCIRALSKHSIMLSPTSVMAAHDASLQLDIAVKDLLKGDVMRDIAIATLQSVADS